MLHWEWAVFGESVVVLVQPILKGSFAFPTFSPPLLAIANTITKEPKLRKKSRILPPIFFPSQAKRCPFALTRGEFLELDPFANMIDLTQSRSRSHTCFTFYVYWKWFLNLLVLQNVLILFVKLIQRWHYCLTLPYFAIECASFVESTNILNFKRGFLE